MVNRKPTESHHKEKKTHDKDIVGIPSSGGGAKYGVFGSDHNMYSTSYLNGFACHTHCKAVMIQGATADHYGRVTRSTDLDT